MIVSGIETRQLAETKARAYRRLGYRVEVVNDPFTIGGPFRLFCTYAPNGN